MPNRSKINDPRFWKRWECSGALKRHPTPESEATALDRGRARDKQEAMTRARHDYQSSGNLTAAEIDERLGYEFVAGATTVREQVRCYYLMVKELHPDKAEQLRRETEPLLRKGVQIEQEVHDLSVVLARYISGFMISSEPTPEMRVEMAQDFPLPLETVAVRANKPYQVWRNGRSVTVQWKAWRRGRPTVLGYGITQDEAVADLRYNVQPDHDGTLDGLGTPKGPTIFGNMFTEQEVIDHNRGRYGR